MAVEHGANQVLSMQPATSEYRHHVYDDQRKHRIRHPFMQLLSPIATDVVVIRPPGRHEQQGSPKQCDYRQRTCRIVSNVAFRMA